MQGGGGARRLSQRLAPSPFFSIPSWVFISPSCSESLPTPSCPRPREKPFSFVIRSQTLLMPRRAPRAHADSYGLTQEKNCGIINLLDVLDQLPEWQRVLPSPYVRQTGFGIGDQCEPGRKPRKKNNPCTMSLILVKSGVRSQCNGKLWDLIFLKASFCTVPHAARAGQ